MDILWTILCYAVGLVVLILICKVLSAPIKLLGKLLINALVGAVILLLFNFFGGVLGLSIAITPLSAVLTGFFGVPAVIILLVLQLFI